MEDYMQYLAQKLLTEDQLVTYRLLSRTLNVHVNTAKEMLYEFHKSQNDKRPGSLHATYLVYGTKKATVKVEESGGDVKMTDSQTSEEMHEPFSDEVPTYTLSIVKEEQLQDLLAEYDEVTSIHIYSLAPHPLKDLQLLADTARQVLELSTKGDVPASSKAFGSITNPNVRKRERRGPALKPVTSASTPRASLKAESKEEAKSAEVKEESKIAPQANVKGSTSATPTATTTTKKPNSAASMKRQGSSGIGQMFAKAAAKPKKPAAKAAAGAAEEDQKMALSDDGEDDVVPMPEVKQESESARQSRKNRQAELRRMMEESEEEEEEKAESPVEEPMEEEEEAPPPELEPKAEEPAEVVSSTGNGRRRGRRRVTRKKQVMDDKGYLVTIQEQGWESFSEDEAPPPPKQKPQPVKSEPAAKPKKAAGKGQGNIMSFFSKK
ncbi:DNA polymerase subunit Cdc27 [Daldinia caldariorum]|uniref:DNA polymerase subunit Cdc27 n=1 Tax=Daldinia caldariorum TaxID=326644 RepID=UPI00200736FA|nr:DNA polymerase subunit Cdc27 [Daldinia caldariorum]KAI1463030.1 DNA polymerase subunit Cdc27 [Daldinia caldariorum]